MAAAGRTRSSDVKLQRCAFDMPSRSIYMPSMAAIQIGVRLQASDLMEVRLGNIALQFD